MKASNYATFWHRLIAQLVDTLILAVVMLLLLANVARASTIAGILDGVLVYIIVFIWISVSLRLLQAYLTYKLGGSMGKLLTGLKVVDSSGKNLTYKKALFRELIAKIPSYAIFWLGFFWVLRDQNRQAWHDQMADSFVITQNKSGMYTGLLAVLIGFVVSFVLGINIVGNFQKNINSYDAIMTDLTSEFLVPSNPTPNPYLEDQFEFEYVEPTF